MFTVALIAGQARANLPAEATADSDFAHATSMSITLETKSLQNLDALSHVVDAIFALPIDVELRFDGLTLRTGATEDAGTDDPSVP